MRWMITGARGQLGSHLVASLSGRDIVALSRQDLDVSDAAAVDATIRTFRPDVVLNAAGYTAVDAAETNETAAYLVNERGPRLLAEALARHGGTLIHVSTDYVFDGRANRPYEPDDVTGPATAYGRSKLAGEHAAVEALAACHVVRTAWVYGGPGRNFVDTMLALQRSQEAVDVVADQIGSPTWVRDLAEALVLLGSSSARPGIVHYVNTGTASWFDVAREVFSAVGADPARVRPVSSAQFPRPAARPAWSVLSTRSWTDLAFPEPRDWRSALRECLATGSRGC
jgi:dTDP-4-dehydrorhamnose reductase